MKEPEIHLSDATFDNLMSKRIYNILLFATKYDSFILEDDGRIDEQIFNEYVSLNLRYPPRFTQVTNLTDALAELSENHYELVVYMPNLEDENFVEVMKTVKSFYENIPFVVLAPQSREYRRRMLKHEISFVDYSFSWLGNSELLLAIIKLIEDSMNVESDTASVGVQVILLVENSVRFYSSELPILYRLVLEESMNFAKEALNEHQEMLRKRGRPKVLLARNYEEAVSMYKRYKENMLGVITDMRFFRNGNNDSRAGYELAKYIKEQDKYLPVILASSEKSNASLANELDFAFLDKNSKSFPQDLRKNVREKFCLGDLPVIDPKTGNELMRIKDLRDLQAKIPLIPVESLRYHMEQNHFSRFCNSHAIFSLGIFLKDLDINNYNLEEARHIIEQAIAAYRKMKNSGIVAVFEKDRYDVWSNFARIGNGSLGGKGRGLAFMDQLVKMNSGLNTYPNFPIRIPRTVVLCTDMFDEFMDGNNLYSIALSDLDDDEILHEFLKAKMPERLLEDLNKFLQTIKNPIAVRSSSMLEDSHYQPFAGIYNTYMIPYVLNNEELLRIVTESIKAVYASVFFKGSKTYMSATKNLIDQEKMAVILQELIGQRYDEYFYPTLSGVARSLNFYPIGNERVDDGVVNLALGLGKYIVDGGLTLRFSPGTPKQILQLSSVKMALKETQKSFCALKMNNIPETFSVNDAFNLDNLSLKVAEKDGTLRYISSTYDANDNIIRDGFYPNCRKIVSFAHILQHELFPLSDCLRNVLEVTQKEMGRAVEIEFAVDIKNKEKAEFYLLQIRPIVNNKLLVNVNLQDLDKNELILFSCQALGHGISETHDIVYVKTEHFAAENNSLIAKEIDELNQKFLQKDETYVLIGPGRWGSSDPWLGIPVSWPAISQAQLIVELGLENYRVDPSQGTHFFQNLTSFGVGYFTLNTFIDNGDVYNLTFFDGQKAEYETQFIRHIHFSKPLKISIDGRKGQGAIEK